jgi:hypothetical protein
MAREADLDLAVLDIDLAGEATYPVADVLRARGIPFVFATGYNLNALPEISWEPDTSEALHVQHL